jgi:hypothetical protein
MALFISLVALMLILVIFQLAFYWPDSRELVWSLLLYWSGVSSVLIAQWIGRRVS